MTKNRNDKRDRFHVRQVNDSKSRNTPDGMSYVDGVVHVDTNIINRLSNHAINRFVAKRPFRGIHLHNESNKKIKIHPTLLENEAIVVETSKTSYLEMLARISNRNMIKNLVVIVHGEMNISVTDIPNNLQKLTIIGGDSRRIPVKLVCAEMSIQNCDIFDGDINRHVETLHLYDCQFEMKYLPSNIKNLFVDGTKSQIPQLQGRIQDGTMIVDNKSIRIEPGHCVDIEKILFMESAPKIYFANGDYPVGLTSIALCSSDPCYDLQFLENIPSSITLLTLRVDKFVDLRKTNFLSHVPRTIEILNLIGDNKIVYRDFPLTTSIDWLILDYMKLPELIFRGNQSRIGIIKCTNQMTSTKFCNFDGVIIDVNSNITFEAVNVRNLTVRGRQNYGIYNVESLHAVSHLPRNFMTSNLQSFTGDDIRFYIDTNIVNPPTLVNSFVSKFNVLIFSEKIMQIILGRDTYRIENDTNNKHIYTAVHTKWTVLKHGIMPQQFQKNIMFLMMIRNYCESFLMLPNEILFILFEYVADNYMLRYRDIFYEKSTYTSDMF